MSAHLVLLPACLQLNMRHSRYGGESLAAEAHGMEREKIRRTAYLRRGMPFERQAHLVEPHPAAIVGHLDKVDAAPAQPWAVVVKNRQGKVEKTGWLY